MKGPEKMINTTLRNAPKDFFVVVVQLGFLKCLFKTSFCSAGMLLLLFLFHTRQEHPSGAAWRQAGQRVGGLSHQGALLVSPTVEWHI